MKDVIEDQKNCSKSESKESLITEILNSSEQKRYNKITHGVKAEFLNLIINANCSIKKAAELLNINYSSAKSIISSFRKQSLKKFKVRRPRNAKTSQFKEISVGQTATHVLTLCSSIGRTQISQKSMLLQAKLTQQAKIQYIVVPKISY